MPGVMAALVASHHGEFFRKKVDDFPLALVTPLRTQYNDVSHVWNQNLSIVPCALMASRDKMNARTAQGVGPSLPYSKREVRGWYVYDWANATFHSTVVTLFLGPYLTALAKAAAGPDGHVHPLGIPVDPRSWWGYLISISVVTQIFALPIAGTIADFSPNKKRLMALFAYTGALATAAMFFLHGDEYLFGGILFLIANLAFGASIVVYNSFLPDIAPPEQRDAVSSTGWGIGYLGGGLLLALNLVLFTKAKALGFSESMAGRFILS